MNPFDRHLRAAVGFLELGMPLDAYEEIESILPELKTLSGQSLGHRAHLDFDDPRARRP